MPVQCRCITGSLDNTGAMPVLKVKRVPNAGANAGPARWKPYFDILKAIHSRRQRDEKKILNQGETKQRGGDAYEHEIRRAKNDATSNSIRLLL